MRFLLLLLTTATFVTRGYLLSSDQCTASSQAMPVTLEHDLSSGFAVSWQPPADSATCVHNYSVCVTVEGSSSCENTSTTWWSTRTVRPCANYSLAVEAVGAAGQLLARGLVAFFTPPSEVTNYTVSKRNSTSMLMTWVVPTKNTCVQKYVLSWRRTTEEESSSVNLTTKDTSFEITGLDPCTMYSVSLAGETANNMETTQGISIYTATSGAPLTVSDLDVALFSPVSILAKWKETSSCIKLYRVCVTVVGETKKTCHHVLSEYLQWRSGATVKPCADYSIAVAAVDYVGQASVEMVKVLTGAPGEVGNLAVASRSSVSFVISWSTPASGASCLLNYEVRVCAESKLAECDRVAAIVPFNSTSHPVTRLVACEAYRIIVKSVGANNQRSYGTNITSYTDVTNQSSIIKRISMSYDFTVTSDDKITLQVNWDRPRQRGCLAGYRVCYKDNDNKNDDVCGNIILSRYTTSSVDVQYCHNYTLQVIPITISGHKYPGISHNLITPPYRVGNLTTKNITGSTLLVTWTPPSVTSSSCLVNYSVYWCLSGAYGCYPASEAITGETVKASVTEYFITHLQSCATYLVWVTAIRSEDIQSEVNFMYTKVGGTVPGKISNLITPRVTCGSVYAEWDAPTANSDCVANYELCWQGVSDKTTTCRNVSFLETQYEITSLRPSTAYNVTVAAMGVDGKMSEATMVQVNTIAPMQLEKLSLNGRTETSISVSWRNPLENTKCTEAIVVSWCYTETQPPRMSNCKPTKSNSANIQADATQYNITGLLPCSIYVISINVSTSENVLSSGNTIRIRTLHKNPEAVEDLSLSSRTETSISVSWRNPAVNTRCAGEVVVSWCYEEPHSQEQDSCQPSRNNSANIPATATQFSIVDLLPCSNYTISIAAATVRNVLSSYATLTSHTSNESPVSIKHLALQMNSSTAILTWMAPSLPKTCMEGYKVCWRPQRIPTDEECSIVTTESYIFDYLPACDEYWTSVRTSRPDGSFSSSTDINLDLATPSEVNNLTVVNHTSDSIEVGWLPPLVNSHCIKNYNVCYDKVRGVKETCVLTPSVDMKCNVTGLQPGLVYNITVKALGSTGKQSVARTLQAATDTTVGGSSSFRLGSAGLSTILANCGVLLLGSSM